MLPVGLVSVKAEALARDLYRRPQPGQSSCQQSWRQYAHNRSVYAQPSCLPLSLGTAATRIRVCCRLLACEACSSSSGEQSAHAPCYLACRRRTMSSPQLQLGNQPPMCMCVITHQHLARRLACFRQGPGPDRWQAAVLAGLCRRRCTTSISRSEHVDIFCLSSGNLEQLQQTCIRC